ncbi:LysE/ArgO family amino acid transporter [Cellulosimicrobium marinum]|uniref:LysE/ArgO family amino acid transporter n=1 Tax=Cellulosimicrobium marinum TaxID=1638992 RepID=UPI001E50A170|nr:LysE family transporter [Cellulosimicrobium marinum]MCB7135536.1 LysE family transporter [Cellulosimicrobium marinum]
MTALSLAQHLLAGLAAGLSLIVAIGAQNAFVLRQGLRREHVLPVVVVCAASDAILVAAGTAGLGALVTGAPAVLTAVRWVGAAFLLVLAALAARRALRPGVLDTASGSRAPGSARAAVGTALALTWLNPHVYLDTVLLLGTLAAGYAAAHAGDGTPGPDVVRGLFGTGAVLGSVMWFTALGYGARLLAPLFARPVAWRVLDGAIAVVMATIAVSLVVGA